MDPFKVLGISAGSVRVSADLDRVRQRSKELYKRYAQEKREADAKRVCKAWDLIRAKFTKKKEGATKTSSRTSIHSHKDGAKESAANGTTSQRRSDHQASTQPTAPTLAQDPSEQEPDVVEVAEVAASPPRSQPTEQQSGQQAAAERPAEKPPTTKKRRREEQPKVGQKAPAAKKLRQGEQLRRATSDGQKVATPGTKSVVRQPSSKALRLPGSSGKAGATAGHAVARQASAKSVGSVSRHPSSSSVVSRQNSKHGLEVPAHAGSQGTPAATLACGERVPRRSWQQTTGFACPTCRFRAMDPFNLVLEGRHGMLRLLLVQPPAVPKSARQEATLKFHLNLPRLQKWRKLGHNIEARMCLLTNYQAQQTWPTSLEFQVNKRKVFEVLPPKSGHVRRDIPHNISAELHSSMNTVVVKIKDDYVQRFALAIVRTAPRLPRQLCKHVPLMGKEECRQRVVELLFSSVLEGSSEEVQCDGYDRSRLICPITLARIETPARGYKCRHLQCFDLVAYLVSNLRMAAFNRRWHCPVCDLVLKAPKDLFIDTYVVQILASAEADAEEVMFDQSGTWKVSARATSPDPPSPEGRSGSPGSPREPEEEDPPATMGAVSSPGPGCADAEADSAAGLFGTQGSAESLEVDYGVSEDEPTDVSSEPGEMGLQASPGAGGALPDGSPHGSAQAGTPPGAGAGEPEGEGAEGAPSETESSSSGELCEGGNESGIEDCDKESLGAVSADPYSVWSPTA
eukprot:CAMPEP_0179180460 /NCGR_PEP_ID=MMETSP0796-20121207/89340_1 /TAXON_ID=73915 /ORGANISM="Pyrodinium bahamense, Strain pbaha01" /LENGTH=740 /DNA_ID=CAMNT_0020884169 /DNA_START=20 /DNA_END=2238 /DNA_ORIENTATION=-